MRYSNQLTAPALAGTGLLTWEASATEGGDFAFDTDDSNLLKYNEAGTIRTVVNTAGTQALSNKVMQTAMFAGGSTLTVTAALHAGRTIALDTAAGTTITLPAATGTGNRYEFLVTVAPTSNQHRIDVVGNDSMLGTARALDTDLTIFDVFAAAADTDRVDMTTANGFGGIGSRVYLVDMLTDEWFVDMTGDGDTSVADPFTTGAVS